MKQQKQQIPEYILKKSAYTANSYTDFLLSQLRRDWIIEPEKDFAWKQDQAIYDKLRLDARYRAVEETLLSEVAALEWNVVSKDQNKVISSVYEWMINKISGFADSRINMAKAVIEGMSVQEIIWENVFEQADGDAQKRLWRIPKKLKLVSRERLRRSVHLDTDSKGWWVWRIFDPYLNRWLPVTDESRYVWSFYRANEENLGYGEGLAKSVYAILKLKVVLLELLAAGAERWVDSWILVKLDDTIKETADLHDDGAITTILQDIAKMRPHGVLGYQGADIQIAPAGQSNTAQTILDMIEKIDREITILLTATNLPTDVAGGGSYAATRGQLQQQNKRLLFQRKSVVEEPLTDYLISACYRWNVANFKAMGLEKHQLPYFKLSGEEMRDPQERIAAFSLASQLGVQISEEDFRTQMNISQPSGGKIIAPPAPPLPQQNAGGFSSQLQGYETTPAFFSQSAVLQDLNKGDQKERDMAIQGAIENLGVALLGMSFGKNGAGDIAKAETDFMEKMQKMLAYYELKGRAEVIESVNDLDSVNNVNTQNSVNSVNSEEAKFANRWITIGSKSDGEENTSGGRKIQITEDGNIVKGGPKHWEGKHITSIASKKAEPKKEEQISKKVDTVADPSSHNADKDLMQNAKEAQEKHKSDKQYWGSKNGNIFYRPGANPTVDNIITRDGENGKEILLIQRADKEGVAERGKWALPGGFHDTDVGKGEFWKPGKETAQQAAMRELAEETGLDASTLEKNMKHVGFFDKHGRDPRDNKEAWAVSNAFHLHLTPDLASAKVQGMDDADNAKWVSVHDLHKMSMAFDHSDIIKKADILPSTPGIEIVGTKKGAPSAEETNKGVDELISGIMQKRKSHVEGFEKTINEYKKDFDKNGRLVVQKIQKEAERLSAPIEMKVGGKSLTREETTEEYLKSLSSKVKAVIEIGKLSKSESWKKQKMGKYDIQKEIKSAILLEGRPAGLKSLSKIFGVDIGEGNFKTLHKSIIKKLSELATQGSKQI